MANPSAAPQTGEIKLIRKSHVLRRVGFGNSELYRRIAAGQFPKPVRIGARAVAWNSVEIEKWIADRIAARDAVPTGAARAAPGTSTAGATV